MNFFYTKSFTVVLLALIAGALTILVMVVSQLLVNPPVEPSPAAQTETEETVEPDVYAEATANPAEELPETNPFAETNPFDSYQNPFE